MLGSENISLCRRPSPGGVINICRLLYALAETEGREVGEGGG